MAAAANMAIEDQTNILLSSFLILIILPLFVLLFFIGSLPGTLRSLRQQHATRQWWMLIFSAVGIVALKIIFLLAFFIAASRIFSYWEGDLFTFIIFIALVIFGSILERSAAWWAGGVIGYFIGATIGFVQGFFWTGILSMIGLGLLGLLMDYLFSRRFIADAYAK